MDNCPYVNVQKSHDFELDEVIDPELKYVVMIRNNRDAIKSWYKQTITYDGDTITERNFEEGKWEYYEKFNLKWVIKSPDETLVIHYEQFIQDKLTTLLRVCNFISTKPLTPYQIIAAKAWEKREANGY